MMIFKYGNDIWRRDAIDKLFHPFIRNFTGPLPLGVPELVYRGPIKGKNVRLVPKKVHVSG